MIPQTLLCGSYAGFFFPQFLRQTVSALWSFVLFNSIALLKTIMRDAGESTSPGQGAENKPPLRELAKYRPNIMRELCGMDEIQACRLLCGELCGKYQTA